MLPKASRLPVLESRGGRQFKSPFFSLHLKPNKLGRNRFLFLIGRKSAKTAVSRHRIKRLLGEAAKTISEQSADFSITALPGAEKLELKDVIQELGKIIKIN